MSNKPILKIAEFEHFRISSDDETTVCTNVNVAVTIDESDVDIIRTYHHCTTGQFFVAETNAEPGTLPSRGIDVGVVVTGAPVERVV